MLPPSSASSSLHTHHACGHTRGRLPLGPQARHGTYYAALALRPGSRGIVTDAAVPISKLAEVIEATAADVHASGVVGPVFGHAGDGNFHCILLSHPDDPPEYTERLRARLRQKGTAWRRLMLTPGHHTAS